MTPLPLVNKQSTRRINVAGVLANAPAIRRLICAPMLAQSDDHAVTRRYMTRESAAAICEDDTMDPAKVAAPQMRSIPGRRMNYTIPWDTAKGDGASLECARNGRSG